MPSPVQSFTLHLTASGEGRLDRVLRELAFPESVWFSRTVWKKLFDIGGVRDDAGKVRKPGETLSSAINIKLIFPAALLPERALASLAPAEAIYLAPKAGFGAFAKPAGVPSYPLLPWELGTFVESVAAYLLEKKLTGAREFFQLGPPPSLEGGLAQRLDTGTSGLMLAAWTEAAKAELREALHAHAITKTYLALITGKEFADFSGREFALEQRTPARMEVVGASTQAIVASCRTLKRAGEAALVEFSTTGGVRHQVRAILAHLGAPLVGDSVYGKKIADVPHHLLHAWELRLPDKLGGNTIRAPWPHAFQCEAERLGIYLGDGEEP